MCKRIVLVAAVLLAACGTDTSKQAGPDQPSTPGPAGPTDTTVPLTGLRAAGAAVGKVIVRRSLVLLQQPVLDENNAPTGEFVDVTVEVFRYITNIDAATTSIQIPHGTGYTVEVIEASAANLAGVRTILAYYKSGLFDVPATTAPAIPEVPFTAALHFPTIYVGLGAPYNTYAVSVERSYPLTGNWSLTCGGASGTVRGTTVTFDAPTSTTLACEALFHLDRSLLVAGEAVNSWEVAVPSTPTVEPSGTVTIP